MTINPAHTAQKNFSHLTHPKYRADIDGLRAIAVLSVVSFHAFPNWVSGGFVGVDIFFIISGFLISTIIFSNLEHDSYNFTEFYSRRIKRIFPALLLVLIICYAFGWFTLLPNEYEQFSKHVAGGTGFVANFMLWNESGYFDNAAETKPLLHLWTLSIEEQFYIIWPLLLWFAWKRRLNLLTITITILVISFALNINNTYSSTGAVAAFYSPQTRFWELLAGSALAYITLYKQNMFLTFNRKLDEWLSTISYEQAPESDGSALRNVQSLLGATLIAIGILVITKEKPFPGYWAVSPTLGTVLVISAGTQAWFNRTVLSNRVLVWFGLISFPLYLWHWPLLSFARIMESHIPSREIRVFAVLFSIVLAWLTYKLVEKPIRFGTHGKAKTVTLTILMVIVGCVGYYTYKQEGFGFRFPKIIQELTSYKYHVKDIWRKDYCFIASPNKDYTAFNSDACKLPPRDEKKPYLLLWGDSLASSLIPGYRTAFSDRFTIVPRTASGCPPLLHQESKRWQPHCKEINDYVLEFVKNEKIKKVVLHSRWTFPAGNSWRIDGIRETISELRKIGVTDIDVIGPVPQWIDGLPKQLYLEFKSDKFHRTPSTRMESGLDPQLIPVDMRLRDLSKELGVNYISPKDIFCNESGCLTRLGETADTLTAWDYGHLTDTGSIFLVSKFPKK